MTSDGFDLILCVMKDEKLYQVLLTEKQRTLLEKTLPTITGDNAIKAFKTPICDVELVTSLYKGGELHA